MQLHDFIKANEIQNLPDDDPQEAFAQFVRIAQSRLSDRIESLSGDNDQRSWQLISDARHGFMNIVVAAAKKFEVDPVASIVVPRNQDYDEQTFRQFQSDLDFFVTQLVLENHSRARRDSVFVSPDLKTKISTYELREKARRFGLPVIHHVTGSTFDEGSLLDLKDAELLTLCLKLNLISEDGFFFFDQCRDTRNNFSAAHPSMGSLDEDEFLVFLSRCSRHALITCAVGNPYGVSNAAVPRYETMIRSFSPNEVAIKRATN